MALILRLFSGSWADRSGRYWSLTILGYAMTAVCVPLLAVTPFVGSLGLALAATLILLERAGKAVRSPSKSALLAGAAASLGRGRGFAVHKALDQVGAFAGPLLVAAVIAAVGVTWPAFAVLAVPGGACMLLLFSLKRHSAATPRDKYTDRPDASRDIPDPVEASAHTTVAQRALSAQFYAFAVSCALGTLGMMTFGVISYHLVGAGLVTTAVVPLLYAAAMGTEAVAALLTGFAYDRWGGGRPVHPAGHRRRRPGAGAGRHAGHRARRGAAVGSGDRGPGLHRQGAGRRPRPAPSSGHRLRGVRGLPGSRRAAGRNTRRGPLHRAPHPAHSRGRDDAVVLCGAARGRVAPTAASAPGVSSARARVRRCWASPGIWCLNERGTRGAHRVNRCRSAGRARPPGGAGQHRGGAHEP